jgi:ABC-2 type transport system ATP-binding protein
MVPGVTKQRIDEVIKLVGLENRIRDKVKTYSLGMRQRLGVAQAILHKPSLLILDEPTNGLDPAGIRELRDYLRRLAREDGISIVVSSHLLSEMELMCDRVAIIQNGKLVDVRLIKEFVEEGGKLAVQFEVDNPSKAQDVIAAALAGVNVQTASGSIEAELEREQIAEMNAKLVQAGVKVFGIKAATKSLEDKFLEMTGSEQIV